MIRRFGIMIAILLCIHFGGADSLAQKQSAGEDEIVAVGDGFEVTQEDVRQLQEYMATQHFRASDEEFINAAVRFRLFAEEAKSLGLADIEEKDIENMDRFPKIMTLQSLYVKEKMNNYPLDDLVIVSYYYAHPELFVIQEENGTGKGDDGNSDIPSDEKADSVDPDLQPLDEKAKRMIRIKILKQKAPVLLKEYEEKLKDKYNVRFIWDSVAAKEAN